MKENFIIAIDGPSGSGKSTVARLLAQRLGITYLDTGAMYRAAALYYKRLGISLDDEDNIKERLDDLKISFQFSNDGGKILLCKEDVTEAIRSPEMGKAASDISKLPSVRKRLVELQRKIGEKRSLVAEGRDIGSCVFPDAPFKFFLDADPKIRAKRRYDELRQKGFGVNLKDIYNQQTQRDQNDATREHSPLIKMPDAVTIDSSEMTIDEVVEKMLDIIKNVLYNAKVDYMKSSKPGNTSP